MKKRTLIMILLSVVFIMTACFILTACDGQDIKIPTEETEKPIDTEEPSDKHIHVYSAIITPPTCTERGYTTYTCECGDSYIDDYVDKLEHDFGAWILTKAPTCTETGIETRYCLNDNTHTETRTVNALDHDYNAVVTEPTCTQKGYTTHTCSRCNDSYVDTYIDALNHDFGAWTLTKEPTCTETGIETRYCLNDNTHTETRTVNALEHDYNAVVTEPTCTEQGYTTHTCFRCKDSYVDTYINATGHEFTNYVSDGNATYDSDGTKTAYCDHGCGEKDTVTDIGTKLKSGIAFKTLSVDGNNVSGKVANNVMTYSFLNEITTTGNVTYSVSYDINGNNTIPSKTTNINEGDNVFYVLEKVNGEATNLFTVNVRRREIYDVTFNANGGTAVDPQRVEEDSFATKPTTTRAGYTFTEWDYDFNKPITKNTAITASWTYYTLTTNINDDNSGAITDYNYTKITAGESVILTATTNAGYTFNGWYDGETLLTSELSYQFIMPSENLSYTAKWTYYTLTTNVNNDMAGTATFYNQKMITAGESITLTATTNAGYTFNGWYNGEALLSNKLEYAFSMPNATVIYTAKWTANTNTKYKVEYYLQNLADNNYTLDHTDNLTGITDTTANAEIKTIEHFTHTVVSNSRESANINGNESTVLNVYYTRDKYTVKIQPQDEKISISTSYNGEFKYGYQINGTSLSSLYLGYDFTGWRNGGELITASNDILPFTVDKAVTLIASYSVKQEMSNFNFSSSLTSCILSGVKDKTISEILIPNYVTSINSGAFNGCNNLATITVSDENVNYSSVSGILYNKQKTQFVHIPSKLTGDIIIPSGIVSIYDQAFANRDGIINLTIPDSVTIIGAKAFYLCKYLTNVTIGCGVTSIGEYAFHYCYNLEKIFYIGTINDWASKIDGVAYILSTLGNIVSAKRKLYINNELVTEVVLNGITEIKPSAFNECESLTSITIPDSVASIGSCAFYGCSNLRSITIPDSVASIGSGAFYECHSLESVTFGNGITSIGSDMFTYCWNLKNVIIPYSITSIGRSAFYRCTSLKQITIPNSVTNIGYGAFEDCSSLTNVTIPDSVTSIGEYAFFGCSSLTNITIPDSVTSIGALAFSYCSALTEINVSEDNEYYKSIDGNLYSKDEKFFIQYAAGKTALEFTILGVVTNIGVWAFSGCKNIESITIGNGVTSIDDGVFFECSNIRSVTIGNSVTSIGYDAFYYCSNLICVYYNGTAEDWAKISIHYSSNEYLTSATRYYYSATAPTDTDYNYWHYVNGEIVVWGKEN